MKTTLLFFLFSVILATSQVGSHATSSGKEFRRVALKYTVPSFLTLILYCFLYIYRRLHPDLRALSNPTAKKPAFQPKFAEQKQFLQSYRSEYGKKASKPGRIIRKSAFTSPRHPRKPIATRRRLYISRARRMRISQFWNFLKKHRLNAVNKCRVKKKGPCCKGWIRNYFTRVCMRK